MKDSMYCNVWNYFWCRRFEILGLALIAIATLLTLITRSDAGIFALFLVGLILMCHKHMMKKTCTCCGTCCNFDSHSSNDADSSCHSQSSSCMPMEKEDNSEPKKPAKTAKARKKAAEQ